MKSASNFYFGKKKEDRFGAKVKFSGKMHAIRNKKKSLQCV